MRWESYISVAEMFPVIGKRQWNISVSYTHLDVYKRQANVRSRNEFVAEALTFYMGYLLAGKAENYFLQSLTSVLTGTVQDSENRLARMDFKLSLIHI